MPTTSAGAMVGLYGHGLCLRQVAIPSADRTIDLASLAAACTVPDHDGRPIERVKVLLWPLGHAIASYEGSYDSAVWRADSGPLSRFVLRGRVDPPPDFPAILSIRYYLTEAMEFFGYVDGAVPFIVLAAVAVDMDGWFTADVPRLLDDPFIAGRASEATFELSEASQGIATRPHAFYRSSLEDLYLSGHILELNDVNEVWRED